VSVLVTCEHGGYRVPRLYEGHFRGAEGILKTHRGWDIGSLALARTIARRCELPLVASTVSRLVVELNRSLGHRRLFSEFTSRLAAAEKERLLARYYYPYRRRVEDQIAAWLAAGRRVVHISIHTFTPVLNGERRRTDVGWLYDPARPNEKQFCNLWLACLEQMRSDLVLRRNHPYLGTSDALTTWLRRHFRGQPYVGMELEVNQRWPQGERADWRRLRRDVAESLAAALARF
jgi:predicted N-formylglutamate amidohydrolase